jgi:hypothetical protein
MGREMEHYDELDKEVGLSRLVVDVQLVVQGLG